MTMPMILSVVGKKGSGKSPVIENVIAHLKQRGYRIGLIKHLSRPGIEIELPEKDTSRYRKCGAETVILSGQKERAIFSDVEEETPLEKLLLFFEGYDLVLLEGYFLESVMKIEVHRAELGEPLTRNMKNVLAILSDAAADQTEALVSSIEDWLMSFRTPAGSERSFLKSEISPPAASK